MELGALRVTLMKLKHMQELDSNLEIATTTEATVSTVNIFILFSLISDA